MADGIWSWEGPQGRLEVQQLGPRFATVELVGRASDEGVPTIDEALTLLMPIPGLVIYWDAFRLESFASHFRARCTEHILANRKTVDTIAVLADSALISMAISATNLALGGILSSYRDRDKFIADREAAARAQGIETTKLAG